MVMGSEKGPMRGLAGIFARNSRKDMLFTLGLLRWQKTSLELQEATLLLFRESLPETGVTRRMQRPQEAPAHLGGECRSVGSLGFSSLRHQYIGFCFTLLKPMLSGCS